MDNNSDPEFTFDFRKYFDSEKNEFDLAECLIDIDTEFSSLKEGIKVQRNRGALDFHYAESVTKQADRIEHDFIYFYAHILQKYLFGKYPSDFDADPESEGKTLNNMDIYKFAVSLEYEYRVTMDFIKDSKSALELFMSVMESG